MPGKDIQVRLVEDSEMEACNQFHNRVYNKSRAFNQWQWEFKTNLYKTDKIPFAVAVNGRQIVGTQALIPIRMIDRDRIYWSAKSEETLVDPQFRGNRLFERMYEVLFEYAREHGISNIWGFTPATKAFSRLEFSIPGGTEQLIIPFSQKAISMLLAKDKSGNSTASKASFKDILVEAAGPFAKSYSALKIALHNRSRENGLELKTIGRGNNQTGELCERFVNHWGGTTIYRNSDYFRWRFYDNPYVRSNIAGIFLENDLLGWVAFALGDDGMGYIIDLLVVGDNTRISAETLTRELLIEAVIRTRNMGACGIRSWKVNAHPFDRLVTRVAKKIGFFHIKRGHAFVLYNCDDDSSRPSANNFNEWYITRAFTEGLQG